MGTMALAFAGSSLAAGGGGDLDHANISLDNEKALQRGAKIYMNYCMGCHSLKFQRYSRMAEDIGLTKEEVEENLIFTTDKYGEPTKYRTRMNNTMGDEYGEQSFGVTPPDLSLVARSRGTDWLYTYLRSFYYDPSRPFGANNTTFPNVGMPHALAPLQGWQKPVYSERENDSGEIVEYISGLEPLEEGKLSEEEYDRAVLDLVTFLEYVGEPAKMVRGEIGGWVLFFLFIFAAIAYALKKEYWRDIH
ncbi:MAG: cytochrome c1 [Pseudomonadota bacterium]